ncbi:Pde11, partial [Symbiodinium sp. KB8]
AASFLEAPTRPAPGFPTAHPEPALAKSNSILSPTGIPRRFVTGSFDDYDDYGDEERKNDTPDSPQIESKEMKADARKDGEMVFLEDLKLSSADPEMMSTMIAISRVQEELKQERSGRQKGLRSHGAEEAPTLRRSQSVEPMRPKRKKEQKKMVIQLADSDTDSVGDGSEDEDFNDDLHSIRRPKATRIPSPVPPPPAEESKEVAAKAHPPPPPPPRDNGDAAPGAKLRVKSRESVLMSKPFPSTTSEPEATAGAAEEPRRRASTLGPAREQSLSNEFFTDTREGAALKLLGKDQLRTFLKSVALFSHLSEGQFESLSQAAGVCEYAPGDVIIRQGEEGHTMFIIRSGEVTVYKNSDPDSTELGPAVGHLATGDILGERALIKKETRAASCVADTVVECLTVSDTVFSNVLSGMHSLLGENLQSYAQNEEVQSMQRHMRLFKSLVLDPKNVNLMPLLTSLSPELNVDDVIERMVQNMYQMFNVDRVGLFLIDRSANAMILKVSKDARGVRVPLSGIAGDVAKSGMMENIVDVYQNDRFNSAFDHKTGYRTRSMLCIPVREPTSSAQAKAAAASRRRGLSVFDEPGSDQDNLIGASHIDGGQVIAVLQLINKRDGTSFSKGDENLLKSVATVMGATLAKLTLEIALDDGKLPFEPIWKIHRNFFIKIENVVNVLLSKKKSFLGMKSSRPSSTLSVRMDLYHGLELLSSVETKSSKADLEKLPRDTYDGSEDEGEGSESPKKK